MLAGCDSIGHEHRDGHRAYSAGDWGDGTGPRRDFIESDVAGGPVTAFLGRILDSVDADINDHSAFSHMLDPDKMCFTDCSHQYVCRACDRRQIATPGVGDCDRGVPALSFAHKKQSQRFTNQHTAADNDHMRPFKIDVVIE
jgi:hypothetical protein